MTQQTERIYKIRFNWRQYSDTTESDEDYEELELGKPHADAKVDAIYFVKFNNIDVVRVEYANNTAETIHSNINRIFYETGI